MRKNDDAPLINKGNSDHETLAAIYQGLNQSQFMALFQIDNRTFKKAVFESGAKPVGRVNRGDIYSVRELAPYIVKPVGDIEAYIKKMRHEDLPKHLSKEFWAGQRSRQEYEEKAGQLWRTEKVVQEVGEIFKLIKISALLFKDTVDRQTTLTAQQKQLIDQMVRGLLNDIRDRILKHFAEPEKAEEPKHASIQEADDEEL